MSLIKMILAACGPLGALICVLTTFVCTVAPEFTGRYREVKDFFLIAGFVMVIVGVAAIFIFTK